MSFDTSNISAGNFTASTTVSAPKHIVGTVELTQDGDNLSVIGVNSEIVNTDDLIASVSVSTPLLTSPELFPMTVSNLQTINLTSGAGIEGQVLGLDSSLNLVWKQDANTPQGLESVLTVSNDANELGITNLKSLTVTSGAGNIGEILSLDGSLNLAWKAEYQPNLTNVLATGNDASEQSINNVNVVQAKSLNLLNTADWSLSANALTNNLDVSTTTGGLLALGSVSAVTTGQISASLLIGKKPDYDYWVSPNGSDIDAVTNGGSLENPFLTIGACLNYCQNLTATDNEYRYIHVLAGNYTEDLLITKKIFIQGEAKSGMSASVGCSISGVITIAVDANGGDMFNNQVTLSGFLIDGVVKNTSTVNHMLCLEYCYIYSPDNSAGQALTHNPSSTDSRLRLWNCQFISGGSSGTSPLVEIGSKGQVNMQYCYLSAKGVQNVLMFSGTATCDTIANCKFENGNSAGLTAKAVCEITANSSATYTFTNCGFIYTSNANKSANPNASGIRNANTSGNNTIISLYNTFLLNGTDKNSNFAIQDFNNGTLISMICLFYMSNALPNTAFKIHGVNNTNKFQMEIVS